MNKTGKNSRGRRRKVMTCNCPLNAPAWPMCCQPELGGVVDANQAAMQPEANAAVALDSGNARVAQSMPAENVKDVDGSVGTPLPVAGGMQPQGGGGGLGGGGRRFDIPKKLVRQVLTGEFRLTKKLIKEQTEAYLASEGTVAAAMEMLSLLKSDSEKIRLAAAKDILDRTGVGKAEATIKGLVRNPPSQNETPVEWLERIVDLENSSDGEK